MPWTIKGYILFSWGSYFTANHRSKRGKICSPFLGKYTRKRAEWGIFPRHIVNCWSPFKELEKWRYLGQVYCVHQEKMEGRDVSETLECARALKPNYTVLFSYLHKSLVRDNREGQRLWGARRRKPNNQSSGIFSCCGTLLGGSGGSCVRVCWRQPGLKNQCSRNQYSHFVQPNLGHEIKVGQCHTPVTPSVQKCRYPVGSFAPFLLCT